MFETLFQLAPCACLLVAPDGTILQMNQAAREKLSVDKGQALPAMDTLFADVGERLQRDLTLAVGSSQWMMSSAEIRQGSLTGLRIPMRMRGFHDEALPGGAVMVALPEAGESRFAEHTRLIRTLNEQVAHQATTQSELEAAVERERYLHRELIHRVKNNLALLSALIRHTERQSDDTAVKDALHAIDLRTRSIALVHELLDRNETVEVINAEELIQELCQLLNDSLLPDTVTMECKVDALSLHNEDATALCILINELVTNSLKHAFAGRSSGRIELHFKRNGVDKMELRVSDDGTGLPGVAPDQALGHGMQFLHALASNLEGELLHETGDGTEWTLIFLPKTPRRAVA